jgi:hypothetical protein
MKTSGEGRAVPPNMLAHTGVAETAILEKPGAAQRGSSGDLASRPLRHSLLRHSPAVVLLAILIADSNRHTDPDLWGHVRFGQLFLAQRHLVTHDPYSYSVPGHLWRDYSWLGAVVMALIYNVGGVVGLKLWKFISVALTVVFIADTEAETDARPSIQLVILILAALGLILQTQFRPQTFTVVLLAGLAALLARDNYRRRAPMWLAIPMMAVWANLHAGFFIGIIMLALYSGVATLCDLAANRGWKHGLQLAAITVAAAIATLANPFGVGLWQAVARTLFDSSARVAIQEWQPMLFAMTQQWHTGISGMPLYLAVVALAVGLAAAFAIAPRGRDLPLVAIAAMMTVGAWMSVRNMALVAITASGPLARHLELIRSRHFGSTPSPSARSANQWMVLALVAFLMVESGLFSNRLVLDQPYPAGALIFMRAHGLHGNVLCEWDWGEYLIWHAAPAAKIFVDGRYDTVYPPEVIHDYLLFRFDLAGGGQVLDTYPHDFVLISTAAPARHLMEQRHDWKLLYRDDDALLYARASAPAASLPGLPVTGTAHRGGFP